MSETDKSKREGRPPVQAGDVSVPVHLKLPSRDYDKYDQAARDQRISLPELIRRKLRGAGI